MNIAKHLISNLSQFNAHIERIGIEQLKLCNAEHVPPELIAQVKAHKPSIIEYLDLSIARQLIDDLNQHNASIELAGHDQLRLHNAEHLPPELIEKTKTNKPMLIRHLNQLQKPTGQPKAMDDFLYEITKLYFVRLEKHRNNLIKINRPIKNALIRPADWIAEITAAFNLNQYEATRYIGELIESGLFYYDCSNKLYLVPDYTSESMAEFRNFELNH